MEWVEDILLKYVNEKLAPKVKKEFVNFVTSKSQRDQVLFYFKHENNLVNKTLIEVFPDYEINTLTRRLDNSKFIENVDKEGKAFVYSLTEDGENYLDRKVLSFLDKNFDYKDYLIEKRKTKSNNSSKKDNVKIMAMALYDAEIKPNVKDKIIINMKDLAIYNPDIPDLIYNNFKENIEIIKAVFQDDVQKDLEDEDIVFTNIHDSEFRPIHVFDREYQGLVLTKGLITSKREGIISKTLLFKYRCNNNSCQYHDSDLVSDKALVNKKGEGIACPHCKSPLNLMSEKRINQLESKITDIDTGISFPLHVRYDLCKRFACLELGDEIEVTGFLEDKVVLSKMGIKETEKVLVVNNFKTTDYIKELTKEELHDVEQTLIKYEKYEDYLLKPFSEYIESPKVKYLFIIQQLTRWDPVNREVPLNIAMMGEPGVGKNVLIKTAETYFPNCDGIVGADITDAGFKGTVNRETGIKEIGLAKKCQNGTLFFNEFDKFVKSNPNGKKGASQLLNASITEQEIRLNKAGIRIRMSNLDLRHNIIFNPLDEKKVDTEKIAYDHMGEIMDKSLLSRMLPLYINKDNKRSEQVFDLMLGKDDSKTKLDPKTYKLVIRYLRGRNVEFTQKAKDLLKKIYKEFLKLDKFQAISVERIGQMLTQLSKGVCRLHGKDKCGVVEVKAAHEIYMFALASVGITMDNLEALFLDKSIEQMKTIKDIKLYIEQQLSINGIKEMEIKQLEEQFDKGVLASALEQLKQTGDYFEPHNGKIRRLK